MNITVNGNVQKIKKETSISLFLEGLGIPARSIAIELNGIVIKREKFDTLCIKNNDIVEIVKFIGGGETAINNL